MTRTLKILITNAASKTVSVFLPMLCNGDVFGKQQKLHLVLFAFKPLIKDVEMLINDISECCFPNLESIESTTDMTKAFEGVDISILLELERNILGFKTNSVLFRTYGLLLNKQTNNDIKVLICGRTANTSAFICSSFSPSINPRNFTVLAEYLRCLVSAGFTRSNLVSTHSQNYPPSPTPHKINAENKADEGDDDDDDDVMIWGSCTSVITSRLKSDGRTNRLERILMDVRYPGAMVIAKAMAEHLNHWLCRENIRGSKKSFCMGVITSGNHLGIGNNLYFNLPVDLTESSDQLELSRNFILDDPLTSALEKASDLLAEERDRAIIDCWRVVLPHSHM